MIKGNTTRSLTKQNNLLLTSHRISCNSIPETHYHKLSKQTDSAVIHFSVLGIYFECSDAKRTREMKIILLQTYRLTASWLMI